ncbi:transposase [Flavobacterium sp. ACAM 123]|jgi:REP element-mobilizing transposase RayT|uniref:transposase n=1 Tax=Flavobacterium sp. ACAM 123 TaxID=1189620 RepID=UPI00036455A1
MPNHIHLLLEIKNGDIDVETHDVETHCSASLQSNRESLPPNLFRKPNSISSFVAILKVVTTKQINVMENNSTKIWQSNYHDHIVRNDDSFNKIYQYIKYNPRNCNIDSINSKF